MNEAIAIYKEAIKSLELGDAITYAVWATGVHRGQLVQAILTK